MVKVLLMIIIVAILMEDGSSIKKTAEEEKEDEEVARAVNKTLAEEEKKRKEEDKKKGKQEKGTEEKKNETVGNREKEVDQDEACSYNFTCPTVDPCPEDQPCPPCKQCKECRDRECGPCPVVEPCEKCPEEKQCLPCKPCGPCPPIHCQPCPVDNYTSVDAPTNITRGCSCPESGGMSVPVALTVGVLAGGVATGLATLVGLVLRYVPPIVSGLLFITAIVMVWFFSSHYPEVTREAGGRLMAALREAALALSHRLMEAIRYRDDQVSFPSKPNLFF
jgi:hypothetical protein